MRMAWNSRLDAKLIRLRNSGLSFGQIAKRMSMSRNAALSRFYWLKRTAERQAKQQRILARLEAEIADGRDRARAIRAAHKSGVSTSVIGRTLGISGQRVWQIAVSGPARVRKSRPDPQSADPQPAP
jgi:hypothetical protein